MLLTSWTVSLHQHCRSPTLQGLHKYLCYFTPVLLKNATGLLKCAHKWPQRNGSCVGSKGPCSPVSFPVKFVPSSRSVFSISGFGLLPWGSCLDLLPTKSNLLLTDNLCNVLGCRNLKNVLVSPVTWRQLDRDGPESSHHCVAHALSELEAPECGVWLSHRLLPTHSEIIIIMCRSEVYSVQWVADLSIFLHQADS